MRLNFAHELERIGQQPRQFDDEAGGVGSVDHPMVIRQRQRQHQPDLRLVIDDHLLMAETVRDITPRIATSGFDSTIGVKYVPAAILPRFVISVNVPPCISGIVNLRSRAFCANSVSSPANSQNALRVDRTNHGNHQPLFGVNGDSQVIVLLQNHLAKRGVVAKELNLGNALRAVTTAFIARTVIVIFGPPSLAEEDCE